MEKNIQLLSPLQNDRRSANSFVNRYKKPVIMFIDTHAHYDLILEDKSVSEDLLFHDMKKLDILYSIQVGIDRGNLKWSWNFAKKRKNDNVLFTLGIHPSSESVDGGLEKISETVAEVKESDSSSLLFGIGECGLDFYRMRIEKEKQIESFIYQINLAKKFNLPLIVHSRDAWDDTISILKQEGASKGIFHCFPGDRKAAKEAIDLGFYISFSGNLTYPKAVEIQDAALYAPLDRIVLETDSPFLSPVPMRGKQNRPDYILHTYRFLAELKKVRLTEIEDSAASNFFKLKKND